MDTVWRFTFYDLFFTIIFVLIFMVSAVLPGHGGTVAFPIFIVNKTICDIYIVFFLCVVVVVDVAAGRRYVGVG